MKVLERSKLPKSYFARKMENHDTEELAKAGSRSINSRVMRNQLRKAGHLDRLDDTQLLYSEFSSGSQTELTGLNWACHKHEAPWAASNDVWICNICGRSLLSKARWVNQLRFHNPRCTLSISDAFMLSKQTFPRCSQVCKVSRKT